MTTFQIAAFVLLGLALAATVTLAARHRIPRRVGVAWSLLWIAAIVAIARPQLTVTLANAIGIARGADLVFYLAILGMLVGFFALFVRMRRFESEMTRIVRELALRAPKEPDPAGDVDRTTPC
ncbi:MAG TPA: DUF2304 domain-containing protein [Thermoanaerobaculia bacterium]|jgi:hypothetical protein|nr:DUF2304 domain-containing protein [Thermoanaerobaculia bacterium]